MTPPSYEIKISRALAHVVGLNEGITQWLASDAYAIRKQVEDDPEIADAVRTSYVVQIPDELPYGWSAYIGDAVHNLRSALDHMALALNTKGYADTHGGAQFPSTETRSEFPIFGDEDTHGNPGKGAAMFKRPRAQEKIAHVPAAAQPLIEAIQPYQRGQEFRTHPLWLVHELDRIDKHRQLVLAAAWIPGFTVSDFQIPGFIHEAEIGKAGPVKDGDVVSFWSVERGVEANKDLEFTRGVAFAEGTPAVGRDPVELLFGLAEYVRQIVLTLATHL